MEKSLRSLSVHTIERSLKDKLSRRKEEGLFRILNTHDQSKKDFFSNDYLGFAGILHRSEELPDIASGSTGSRLISGNSDLAESTEKHIAAYHGFEAALIYSSGYTANLGLFSCIAGKEDTFIADEFIHASIIDGMRLSHAHRFKFRHNDVADLEKKLRQSRGNVFVVVESVYSMNGDFAPLDEIADMCAKHNAALIADEAHAVGVYGERGEGIVSSRGLNAKVFACVYTFGKALGLHGAAIAGSETLKNYLVNFSRPFIYTTAPPPVSYQLLNKAYQMLPAAERQKLSDLISLFKASLETKTIRLLQSDSPIQALVTSNGSGAVAMAEHLYKRGFLVKAVLAPTVPAGSERIRICLHSFNSPDEVRSLATEINNFAA